MVTDTSSIGWGAWIAGENAQGFWNRRLSNKHSNYRELFAVLMGLVISEIFGRKDCTGIVRQCDYSGFYRTYGGSQRELDSIARAIHVQSLDLKITLKARLVSRKLNWRADQLSRLGSTYEWMLHPNLFR